MVKTKTLPFSIHHHASSTALLVVYAPDTFNVFDRPVIEMCGPDEAEHYDGCILHSTNDDGVHWTVGERGEMLPMSVINQPHLTVLVANEHGHVRHTQVIELPAPPC